MRRLHARHLTLLTAFASLFTAGLQAEEARPAEVAPDLPEAYEQIIPRGRIASVDEPKFVPAAEAELPDDAWVLGVEVDGEARAYSLNLLNHHEVVNDAIGELTFAAVW